MASRLDKSLATAIQRNNAREVRRLLLSGADPNKPFLAKGRTAVHLAVEHRAHATLQVLCEMNGDGTRRDYDDIQPIGLAAGLGDKESLRILQNCLKSYRKSVGSVGTSLAPASVPKRELTAQEKFESKLSNTLHSSEPNLEFTEFLLSNLVELRAMHPDKIEAIVKSFHNKDKAILVEYLYSQNAEQVIEKYRINNNLFHYFIMRNNPFMLEYLINEGIFNINTPSNDGKSALATAYLYGAKEALIYLLRQPSIDWNAPGIIESQSNTILINEILQRYPDLLRIFKEIKGSLPPEARLYLAEDLGREIYVYNGHGLEECDSEGNVIEFPVPPGNIVVQVAQCGLVSRASPLINKLLLKLYNPMMHFLQDPVTFKKEIEAILTESSTLKENLRVYLPGDMLTLQTFYPGNTHVIDPTTIQLGQSGLNSKRKILSSGKQFSYLLNNILAKQLHSAMIPINILQTYLQYSEYPTFDQFLERLQTLYPKERGKSYTQEDLINSVKLLDVFNSFKKTNQELMAMYPGVHYNLVCRYTFNPKCRIKGLTRRRQSMEKHQTALFNVLQSMREEGIQVEKKSKNERAQFGLQRVNEPGQEPDRLKNYEPSEFIMFLSQNIDYLKSVLTPADIEKIRSEAVRVRKSQIILLAIDLLLRRPENEINNPIDIPINYETNPLVIFTKRGSTGMVKYLLEHGADPNQVDFRGTPVLLSAMNRAYSGVVREFLKRPDLRLDMKARDGAGVMDFVDKVDADLAEIISQKVVEQTYQSQLRKNLPLAAAARAQEMGVAVNGGVRRNTRKRTFKKLRKTRFQRR